MSLLYHLPEGWADTPDLLLEDIYRMLSFPDRHSCSRVCWAWYHVFFNPRVWRSIVVSPTSFTYRRFNLYQGYQREISKHRVQMWLHRVGRHVQAITVKPSYNLHNIYGFIEVLERFLTYFDEYPMPMLRRFSYTFGCEVRDIWTDDLVVIGTGGPFLELLRRLLGQFKHLRSLTLNHLLLDSQDVDSLLDNFVDNNGDSLEYLELLNCVKIPYPMYPIRNLANLRVLQISPALISDDMLIVVIQETKLQQLVLTQDRYSSQPTSPVEPRNWWLIKQIAPYFEVSLEVTGRTEQEVIIQPEAPVARVFYCCYKSQVRSVEVNRVVDEYRHTLREYGHGLVSRKYRPRSFSKRADSSLVLLARECKKLETLVITERVSTATLLLIATEAKRLKTFVVRKNAVILRCDWTKESGWKQGFFQWLRAASASYEETEREISKLLGQRWNLLTDREFLKH